MSELVGRDLEEGVALIVDLARATDPELRRQVRALAGELILPAARSGSRQSRAGSLRLAVSRDGGVDLDVDATLERLAEAPMAAAAPGPVGEVPTSRRRLASTTDLRWQTWQKPGRAYVLAIDASGSVAGDSLRAAIVSAAALAERVRSCDQLAVLVFWSRAVLLRHLSSSDPPAKVIDQLLSLSGGDTTDIAAGLRLAFLQAASAVAPLREVIVLTDGLATAGEDPVLVAAAAESVGAKLHVLAVSPEEESLLCCRALASAGGGHIALLSSPMDAPTALVEVLG